jgi:mercuric ion binding protein
VRLIKVVPIFLILAGAIPAVAATRTVTLNVPTMTCPVCPITVRKALRAVPGVDKVDVEYAQKKVIVTYDDARTNVAALTKATANAGYQSSPAGKRKK